MHPAVVVEESTAEADLGPADNLAAVIDAVRHVRAKIRDCEAALRLRRSQKPLTGQCHLG